MGQRPSPRRPLLNVLLELRYLKPFLVLERGPHLFRIDQISSLARREAKSGHPDVQRYLSAFDFWWEEDPDGKVVVMRQTPDGPWPLAAEQGSRNVAWTLDNEGGWHREMMLSGSTRKVGDPEYQDLREGLWRMIQRIHRGIPGYNGTGTVHDGQFTGGNAGVGTAWMVKPYSTFPMIDALPIAGFYGFGQYWVEVLRTAGLLGDVSDILSELNSEFGLSSDADLEQGTVPNPDSQG